jgi:hypothetical protein
MTDRLTVDTITSDQLDALYDQLEDNAAQHDRAMKTAVRERETYRQAWKEAQRMRAKAEARAEAASRVGTQYMARAERAEAQVTSALDWCDELDEAAARIHPEAKHPAAGSLRARLTVGQPEVDDSAPGAPNLVHAETKQQVSESPLVDEDTTTVLVDRPFRSHRPKLPPMDPVHILGVESQVDVERLVDEDGEPLCTCTYGERCPNCRD